MTTTKTTQILTASVFGTMAFNSGKKRVPYHDLDFNAEFKTQLNTWAKDTVEGEATGIELMKAWTNAWDNANLAAAQTVFN